MIVTPEERGSTAMGKPPHFIWVSPVSPFVLFLPWGAHLGHCTSSLCLPRCSLACDSLSEPPWFEGPDSFLEHRSSIVWNVPLLPRAWGFFLKVRMELSDFQ